MSEAVTLTHETAKPSTVTTKNPTTITQLKAQGYRVASEAPPVYDDRKAADLKAEIERRNAEAASDDEVIRPESRKKDDLIAALQADDDRRAAAAEPGPDAEVEVDLDEGDEGAGDDSEGEGDDA